MLIKFKQNNAKVVMPGQGGTPVPNSGYVDKVYFNTALSVEEVHAILDTVVVKLSQTSSPSYVALLNSSNSSMIYIIVVEEGQYAIADMASGFNYFNTTEGFDFYGWNPEFNGIKEFNDEAVNENNGRAVAAENDKLTALLSVTPNFGSGSSESYPLSGDYDGSAIAVSGKLNAGEPVPNDGSFVEYLYFNTDLSMEEVDAILDTIEFHPAKNPERELPNYHYLGYADADGNGVSAIGIAKYDDGYAIAAIDAAQNIAFTIYNSSETYKEQINLIGWHTPFGMPILTNKTTISETMDGTPIGEQNDKLDGLISIAPFNKSEIVIDMKELLESGKLPLSINVTIEK